MRARVGNSERAAAKLDSNIACINASLPARHSLTWLGQVGDTIVDCYKHARSHKLLTAGLYNVVAGIKQGQCAHFIVARNVGSGCL
jgi:hypothetical protein